MRQLLGIRLARAPSSGPAIMDTAVKAFHAPKGSQTLPFAKAIDPAHLLERLVASRGQSSRYINCVPHHRANYDAQSKICRVTYENGPEIEEAFLTEIMATISHTRIVGGRALSLSHFVFQYEDEMTNELFAMDMLTQVMSAYDFRRFLLIDPIVTTKTLIRENVHLIRLLMAGRQFAEPRPLNRSRMYNGELTLTRGGRPVAQAQYDVTNMIHTGTLGFCLKQGRSVIWLKLDWQGLTITSESQLRRQRIPVVPINIPVDSMQTPTYDGAIIQFDMADPRYKEPVAHHLYLQYTTEPSFQSDVAGFDRHNFHNGVYTVSEQRHDLKVPFLPKVRRLYKELYQRIEP